MSRNSSEHQQTNFTGNRRAPLSVQKERGRRKFRVTSSASPPRVVIGTITDGGVHRLGFQKTGRLVALKFSPGFA